MIDPGHGGSDGGMVRNGLLEKDWTLKIGVALAEELRQRGHKVALTRDMDTTIPLEERPVLVNAAPRIALLSIHFNAGTPDAGGVETWYSWPKKPEVMARLHNAEGVPVLGVRADDGQRLAQAVQEAVTGQTGARDRGIKNREDLAMTSRTVCPAILIECGFLSNGPESRKIQDANYRKKLVQGIANGYESWLKDRADQPVGPLLPAMAVGTGRGQALPAAGGDEEH
jgi:N-acetylmuramoyl-L-alanine amidase